MIQRKAFTLIELMVSISILSIMMIYLYSSYSSLNKSNDTIKKELNGLLSVQKFKKIIFKDFLLAKYNSTVLQNRDNQEDFVYLQSSNSIHKRHNPYITYLVKDKKLYRLESLEKFTSYELEVDSEFDIDYIAKVENFRVYKSSNTQKEAYLIHIDFKNEERVVLKVNVLNEY